jgi:ABC-type multidrug transport system fused ATPase/permease subunit
MIKRLPFSKNLRLLNELMGARLKKQLAISCTFILFLSLFDFFVLTLIYQLVNSLLQSQSSTFSKFSILKTLESVSPLMLLAFITLTVGMKSLGQYLNSLAINSIHSNYLCFSF